MKYYLSLFRKKIIGEATIGSLMVTDRNGVCHFQCSTLEHITRPQKIMGRTAIPAAYYQVKYSYSTKFKRQMPYLLNVKNFSGVMIHVGNELKDTAGCILVGHHRDYDKAYLYSSRVTFEHLDAIIKGAEVSIGIYDPVEPADEGKEGDA